MTAEGIITQYQNYLTKEELKGSTIKLYLSHAKAFIRNVFQNKEANYKSLSYNQVADYVNSKKSRKANLSGFFGFMLDRGLLNFDKFQNKNEKSITLLIENYLRDMRISDRKIATIDTARSMLELLHAFLTEKEITQICSVSRKLLSRFASYLQMKTQPHKHGKSYEPAYRAQVLIRVKDFFRYLRRSGEILYDPSTNIIIPKLPKRVYRNILRVDEVDLLEAVIDQNSIFGFRDLCIIETIYATGIRVAEAANLIIEDLNFEDKTLLVRQGKGRKDRIVPANAHTCSLLNQYLIEIRPKIIEQTSSAESYKKGMLFLNIYGKAVHKDWITKMVSRYATQAGIEKKVTAHTLRHSVASAMLKAGADIRYIQELLGHKSLSSTQKYTKVVIEDLKITVAKYHPLEVDCCCDEA